MATQITVGWQHEGESYRVTGTYEPGHPGRGPRNGDPGEPPEGPGFDVDEVREDGAAGLARPELVEIAQADLDLAGEAEEAERDAGEAALEDAADSRHEYRAERGW